jgi:mannan endo-1,4-beta-mannosidase
MVWNDGNPAAGVTDKNNFWTGDYYNTLQHKRKVYAHSNVITLDKLPNLKPAR